jgi:hypothetical protein
MKQITRRAAAALMAAMLLAGTSAWAGACCSKTAKATKDGKTCAACQTKECCKEAAKTAAKAEGAKPCEKCAAKAKKDA